MQITRKSTYSGVERTMDLPITQEQIDAWNNGMLIQRAFPHLTPDQREFLQSGMIQEEWDALFGDD